jgi:hypothetical protein
VIDGAGNPWFEADVGVENGRIVDVGRVGGPAARTIDADGLFVCPGFTDMHTHSDLQLLANPAHECKVHQGVTCDVIGQDGLSLAPVNDDTLGQLRAQLAGWNDDPPGRLSWRRCRQSRLLRPRRRDQRGSSSARHRAAARDGRRRPRTYAESWMKRPVRSDQGGSGGPVHRAHLRAVHVRD